MRKHGLQVGKGRTYYTSAALEQAFGRRQRTTWQNALAKVASGSASSKQGKVCKGMEWVGWPTHHATEQHTHLVLQGRCPAYSVLPGSVMAGGVLIRQRFQLLATQPSSCCCHSRCLLRPSCSLEPYNMVVHEHSTVCAFNGHVSGLALLCLFPFLEPCRFISPSFAQCQTSATQFAPPLSGPGSGFGVAHIDGFAVTSPRPVLSAMRSGCEPS